MVVNYLTLRINATVLDDCDNRLAPYVLTTPKDHANDIDFVRELLPGAEGHPTTVDR
jgi:hypothetical protein